MGFNSGFKGLNMSPTVLSGNFNTCAPAMRYHTPEDSTHHSHSHEKFTSHKGKMNM